MSILPQEIQLTVEQKAQLAKLAELSGKPWNEVLEEALAAYHPTSRTNGPGEKSFFEVALRLGLIGCIKGTSPDLSTNKDYMEGFGKRDS